MHHHYDDIRSKIAEAPQWHDEFAVPRYCAFAPGETSNIYAREAALVLITCQGCGAVHKVAFTSCSMDMVKKRPSIADRIRGKSLHYGDPPNAGCCAAGPTMNSEPRKVLEYWRREKCDWVRDPSLEISIEPEWAES
jgi:hypothetical protein